VLELEVRSKVRFPDLVLLSFRFGALELASRRGEAARTLDVQPVNRHQSGHVLSKINATSKSVVSLHLNLFVCILHPRFPLL
jgi:hypothetical protein